MTLLMTGGCLALVLMVGGCGGGTEPAAEPPRRPEGRLPTVARAPEGGAVPAPRRETQPDEPADAVEQAGTASGDEEVGGTEDAAPAINPIDGSIVDDPEKFEPRPLPADRKPFSSDDFPKPGELSRQPPAAEKPDDLVKAEAGLGEKGHYESKNVLTVALSARFRTEEQILLGQIDQAIQMFRAVHGRVPKDHEEFIKKVVAENGYRLPELPDGQTYFYDPSRGPHGELMVRIPKQ
ncbi:MAG: hypothetical protein WD030_04430 [Pirellulales bacterium]